jgi:hypothetical protein
VPHARDNDLMAVCPNIELRRTALVPTDCLEFDPDNPRLIEEGIKNPSDEEIILALADTSDLSEVVQSIAANGYFDIEPLIGMKVKSKWRVLEGNRRLAAIRILQNPAMAKGTGVAVPDISAAHKATLHEVSVYAVTNKEQAREYIGFKHINGPHRWDALAKARFAADWYAKEKGATLEKIAKRLGDNHATVARLVSGMFVLDQAKKENLFEIQDRYPGRKFAFSHLYTALTRSGYRDFLGLSEDWRVDEPEPNPIPKKNLENLKTLLVWLYGSREDDVKPVITSQNPDVKNLAAVLINPRSRTLMMARNNLAEAFNSIESKGTRFESALVNAKQYAETALSQIIGYDSEDSTLLEIGKELSDTSKQIYVTMESMMKKPSKGKK